MATDFSKFRIVGVHLDKPIMFAAKSATRFYLANTDDARRAQTGLMGASADCVVEEFAWGQPGQSVFIKGSLRGSKEVFVICVALGPGDRVILAPPQEEKKQEPQAQQGGVKK